MSKDYVILKGTVEDIMANNLLASWVYAVARGEEVVEVLQGSPFRRSSIILTVEQIRKLAAWVDERVNLRA